MNGNASVCSRLNRILTIGMGLFRPQVRAMYSYHRGKMEILISIYINYFSVNDFQYSLAKPKVAFEVLQAPARMVAANEVIARSQTPFVSKRRMRYNSLRDVSSPRYNLNSHAHGNWSLWRFEGHPGWESVHTRLDRSQFALRKCSHSFKLISDSS